jgi:hypothetical protein
MVLALKNGSCFNDIYVYHFDLVNLSNQKYDDDGLLIIVKKTDDDYIIHVQIIEANILIKKILHKNDSFYVISIEIPNEYENKYQSSGLCYSGFDGIKNYKISKKNFYKKSVVKKCESYSEKNLCFQNIYFTTLIEKMKTKYSQQSDLNSNAKMSRILFDEKNTSCKLKNKFWIFIIVIKSICFLFTHTL